MMKTLTIILMVVGLVVAAAFSNVSSDEGPTVIIVGPERGRQETLPNQEPVMSDEQQMEQNYQEEESPDAGRTEGETSDEQYMEETEQGRQDMEAPEGE
jgi:hypothetical protein